MGIEMTDSKDRHFQLTEQDLEEVLITPEECSTQGGEPLVIVFPCTLPNDPVLIFLHGSSQTHKLEAQRVNSNTISVILPAHKPAEVVDVSVYQMPPMESEGEQEGVEHVYQPRLLIEDKLLYTDMSSYLAELLVQSVSDGTQAFYSMLPPLSSFDEQQLESFDRELTNALKEVELPEGWNLVQLGDNNSTLLHFAARNSLVHLFSLLLSFPGGLQAATLSNSEDQTPLDLARDSGCTLIVSLLESASIVMTKSSPPSLPPQFSSTSSSSVTSCTLLLQSLININNVWMQSQLELVERESSSNRHYCVPISSSYNSRTPTPLLLLAPPDNERVRLSSAPYTSKEVSSVGGGISPFFVFNGWGRGWAWSRVVGNRKSRSVGTGLNELYRLTGGHSLLMTEASQDDNIVSNNSRNFNKEVCTIGCCVSCPLLCDDAVADLIHSTLTSPKSFNNNFQPLDSTHLHIPPDSTHLSHFKQHLITVSVEEEERPYNITSPQPLPVVCIEDAENGDGLCMLPSSLLPPRNVNSFGHSSGEEDEEEEGLVVEGPLFSKSAPSFGGIEMGVTSTSSLGDLSPRPKEKSYSVSEQGEYEEEREKERENKRNNYTLEIISAKVSTTPSSPITTPTLSKRSHRKSSSVSGVLFHPSDDERDQEDERESGLVESRSHTNSFVSTSSKQESISSSSTSEEDDDEDQFLTANEKSTISLLSPSNISLERPSPHLLVKQLHIVTSEKSSADNSQSEDDIVDGQTPPTDVGEARTGRRYSLNVVTNVDDYSASSEDEGHTPLSRRRLLTPDLSTPTHKLSVVHKDPTSLSDHTPSGHASEDDVNLSDIEVQVHSSLDNSFNKTTPPNDETILHSNGSSPNLSQEKSTEKLVEEDNTVERSPKLSEDSLEKLNEKSPQNSPKLSPKLSPKILSSHEKSPKKSPERSPERSPKISPKISPERSMNQSPQRSPKRSPNQSPKLSPERSPKSNKSKSTLVSRSSVPTDLNAKQTIRILKSLLHDEEQCEIVNKTRADTMPIRPLSESSFTNNTSLKTTPISLHSKISRNTSSASDTGITYLTTSSGGGASSSLDFVQSSDGRISPRMKSHINRETSPHPPSPLSMTPPRTSLLKSPDPTLLKVIDHSSSLDKKAKSVDNLISSEETVGEAVGGKVSATSGEKEQVRYNVRFENDETEKEEFKGNQRKDIQSYLGIIEPGSTGIPSTSNNNNGGANGGEIKEQHSKSKGISKLFRRDSKKDKRSKKTDSQSSLDSVFPPPHEEKLVKGGKISNSHPPILHTLTSQPASSPSIIRKPRSQTIHGDLNLTHSFSQEFQQPAVTTSTMVSTTKKESKKSSTDSTFLYEEDEKKTTITKKGDRKDTERESTSHESISPPPPPPSSSLSPQGKGNKLEASMTMESEISEYSLNIDDHPVLADMEEENEVSWYRTIDRRLRRSINKHERGRQGVIFDFVRTERHIYRSVLICKLFFRDKMATELNMSEDVLDTLFPNLDKLVEVAKDFSTKLEARQRQSTLMINDISDILLEQFTGSYGERMKEAYTGFICHQSEALELYRDLERKRHKFSRLMSALYAHKHCERRKLPDFFLLITQRVAKYVEMMKKLLKETDALKLDHVDRLRESSKGLQTLVASIDHGVLLYENRKELEDIQSRLEIQLSRNNSKPGSKFKGLKKLDLLAQNRLLVKTADVQWHGRNKSISVHLVLVTDLIVLLTERDQKYHLASLQDWNPPVIRLFYLHVRVDAAVRSGVQLLLLVQGDNPEMFRIEFSSKKQAKIWEETLNTAVEYCRTNNLRCDHFGAEPVLSGDEGKEEDELDGEVDPLPDHSPNAIRHIMIHHALTQAHQHLNASPVTMATTSSAHDSQQYQPPRHSVAIATITRNHQLPPSGGSNNARNKPMRSTTFHTSRTASMDVIEMKKKKKPPERGASFVDKKEDLLQERANLLECINNLKDSVEFLLKEDEEKTAQIAQLNSEIQKLKAAQLLGASPVFSRPNSAQRSSTRIRPHSVHSDLFKPEEDDLREEEEGEEIERPGTASQIRTS